MTSINLAPDLWAFYSLFVGGLLGKLASMGKLTALIGVGFAVFLAIAGFRAARREGEWLVLGLMLAGWSLIMLMVVMVVGNMLGFTALEIEHTSDVLLAAYGIGVAHMCILAVALLVLRALWYVFVWAILLCFTVPKEKKGPP